MAVFSHGSGSGRLSPRNRFVADELRRAGLGTLFIDLLTPEEDELYETRFDIDLLTERLGHAVSYLARHKETRALPLGLFGASTGAASALRLAALRPEAVGAVVSRSGRPASTAKPMRASRPAKASGLWCRALPTSSRSPERWTRSHASPRTGSSGISARRAQGVPQLAA